MEPYVFDANGWAQGAIAPLPTAKTFSLLAPEPSPRIDAGRWAHQARASLRAVLELAQPKRYPSATLPLVDAVFVDVVHLDAVETSRPTRVLVITLPLDRAPEIRAAAAAGAEAIGGAGFDVLVTRGQRLWQVRDAVDQGADARAPLAVAAMLAAVYLAPILPPGGGTIFGLKTARQRLEALHWKT